MTASAMKMIGLACVMLGVGFAIGQARAQTAGPDFEVQISAPPGETVIECVRGCDLQWVERGLNANSRPEVRFSYGCRGNGLERCASGRIGGWVRR